jgi:hypothetical protein
MASTINTSASATSGTIAALFTSKHFVVKSNDLRIKFLCDDSITVIKDLGGNVIGFSDLKLDTLVTVTPVASALETAATIQLN